MICDLTVFWFYLFQSLSNITKFSFFPQLFSKLHVFCLYLCLFLLFECWGCGSWNNKMSVFSAFYLRHFAVSFGCWFLFLCWLYTEVYYTVVFFVCFKTILNHVKVSVLLALFPTFWDHCLHSLSPSLFLHTGWVDPIQLALLCFIFCLYFPSCFLSTFF